jgi:hypothetical protein
VKRDDVFDRVAPPAGGLAALRARLDRKASGARFVLAAAAAVAVVAAIALILAGRRDAVDVAALARDHGGPSAITLGLAGPPAAAVTLTDDQRATAALDAVPTSDSRVAFYWVSSTSWEQ